MVKVISTYPATAAKLREVRSLSSEAYLHSLVNGELKSSRPSFLRSQYREAVLIRLRAPQSSCYSCYHTMFAKLGLKIDVLCRSHASIS